MPYVQFDLDAMDGAVAAAPIIGLPAVHVMGGLVNLWAWCWRKKTDRTTAVQIEGLMAGGSSRTIEALTAFGFLEQLEGNEIRVRGAQRYLRLKEQASAAGKASAQRRQKKARNTPKTQLTVNRPLTDGQLTVDGPSTSSNIIHQSSIIEESKDSSPAGPAAVKLPRPSQLVLEHWARATKQPEPWKFGPSDYALIEKALKTNSATELMQAADGIANDNWDGRGNFGELKYIYGDPSCVRRFRKLAVDGPKRPKFDPNGKGAVYQLGVPQERGPVGLTKL